MTDNTSIEWTDATWNPVTGCDKVSAGCDHCYAETIAHRFAGTKAYPNGFQVTLRPDRLDWPLRKRKPMRIFVNSMSDLFHDQVPDQYIAGVFAVMARAPHHTFQCLTKRHARMRALLNSLEFRHQVVQAIDAIQVDQEYDSREVWLPIPGYQQYEASTDGHVRRDGKVLSQILNPRTGRYTVSLWVDNVPKTLPVHRLVLLTHDPKGRFEGAEVCHRNGNKLDNRRVNLRWGTGSENQAEKVRHGSRGGPKQITAEIAVRIRAERTAGRTQQNIADEFNVSRSLVSLIQSGKVWAEPDLTWPLPNVHLGVSIENQQWANIRIPALLDTPAAVRFISAEPLLGPIDIAGKGYLAPDEFDRPGIAWVIVGGESGHHARPMNPRWARSLRDQCVDAGVAFHFKQWGEWGPAPWKIHREPDEITIDYKARAKATCATHAFTGGLYQDDRGAWVENVSELSHQPWSAERDDTAPPEAEGMRRWGKKHAGRELDGREWSEYPA